MGIISNTPESILNQLKTITSMVMYAAEAATPEQVLQRISHVARELVGAKYAALGVPDGHGGLRYFMVSGISQAEIDEISHPPIGEGLLGVIMNDRTALRLDHMKDDPRAVEFPKGHPHMDSLLGVPVQVGDALFGMLYLTDREDGRPFNQYDQWLLETLAGYAALAIAGSRLREQESRLTLLEERQRIGMELHDGVIQSLYAVGMHLDLMQRLGKTDSEQIGSAIDGLNGIIEDIRKYIMDLKTTQHKRSTIREVLEDVLNGLYVPEGLQLSIEAPDHEPPFEADDFDSICLMVREALSNALRHAAASYISVRCWQDGNNGTGKFHITVKDDGVGFNPSALDNQNGLGLRNIRERARKHGGIAQVRSASGYGTTLLIEIPMPTS